MVGFASGRFPPGNCAGFFDVKRNQQTCGWGRTGIEPVWRMIKSRGRNVHEPIWAEMRGASRRSALIVSAWIICRCPDHVLVLSVIRYAWAWHSMLNFSLLTHNPPYLLQSTLSAMRKGRWNSVSNFSNLCKKRLRVPAPETRWWRRKDEMHLLPLL